MKKLSKLVSLMLSVVLCIGMAAPAFALQYNIADGDVHIENDDKGVFSYQIKADDQRSENAYKTDEDPDIIITGTTTEHTVTVGKNVTNTTITLEDVSIDLSATGKWGTAGKAAFSAGEGSDVTVELEGENTLKSGVYRTGLELGKGASVTIQDAVKSEDHTPSSLTAEGGVSGAGIGSKTDVIAGDITITGGAKVNAVGGGKYPRYDDLWYAGGGAGIGGGNRGGVRKIEITNGANVTAKALADGAGIGGGAGGKGTVESPLLSQAMPM